MCVRQPADEVGYFANGANRDDNSFRERQLGVEAQDIYGHALKAVTYIADGLEVDGQPSLRYLTLRRDGARAHGLPPHWLRVLDGIEHAQ